MPTIRGLRPAAARRRCASAPTFAFSRSTAAATHAIGSGSAAQAVTSLPPIDTVIRPTLPRFARRNASAAAICVVPA